MYSSNCRRFNRGSGRVPPKPYASPQSHPPCRGDIFMEAGRLAAEYLISRGFLLPSSFLNKSQNGTVKDFWGQDRESVSLPSEDRTLVLSRLGDAGPDASPDRRRRRSDPSIGTDFDWIKAKRRTDSWSEKSKGLPEGAETTDTAHFGGYQGGRTDSFGWLSSMQRGGGEISSVTEAAGVSESEFVEPQSGDAKQNFSAGKKELQIEADDGETTLEVGEVMEGLYKDRMEKRTDTEQLDNQTNSMELDTQAYLEELDKKNDSIEPDRQIFSVNQDRLNNSVELGRQTMSQEADLVTRSGCELLVLSSFMALPTKASTSLTSRALNVDVNHAREEEIVTDRIPPREPKRCVEEDSVGDTSSVSPSNLALSLTGLLSNNSILLPVQSVNEPGGIDTMSSVKRGRCMEFNPSFEPVLSICQPGFPWSLSGFEITQLQAMPSEKNSVTQSLSPRIGQTGTSLEWGSHSDDYFCLETLRGEQSESETNKSLIDQGVIEVDRGISVNLALFSDGSAHDMEKECRKEKQNLPCSFKVCDLNLTEASDNLDDTF
ncbi:uncharacterized protein At4g26450-like [Aristolochia californica]|uniref:uncharacterized protein At4g26450-like n=1 Tax=Aristolochia californica TaxID=171875 RepID=UPI0035DD3830